MKMINALEGFKAMDSAGAQVALIEGFGILLRCLYPATPTPPHALWSELGYASALAAICWMRLGPPGGRGGPGARRDRTGAASQRQAARCRHACLQALTRPPSKPLALASEAFVEPCRRRACQEGHRGAGPLGQHRRLITMLTRRHLVALPAAALLAGCGFKLRGKQNFAFETIAVTPEEGRGRI